MGELRRYFDDIELGEEYESPGRTVTEADIVIFAGLSGDYNVLHTDAEIMKQSIFGERIAHGLLGLAIQAGLFTRATQAYATLAFVGGSGGSSRDRSRSATRSACVRRSSARRRPLSPTAASSPCSGACSTSVVRSSRRGRPT